MKTQNFVIPFGKYKGKDLLYVTENNIMYLEWLSTVAEGTLKIELDKLMETDHYADALHEHLHWLDVSECGFDPLWDVGSK